MVKWEVVSPLLLRLWDQKQLRRKLDKKECITKKKSKNKFISGQKRTKKNCKKI